MVRPSLRRFQIHDQLELGGLLDGEIGRLGAFENFIHEVRGTMPSLN